MIEIPILDWSPIIKDNHSSKSTTVHEVATKLITILKEIGFVYIQNHGISEDAIDGVESKAEEFFNLPHDVKMKYKRGNDGNNWGYVTMEGERLNPDRPGDLKESFNITPYSAKEWPEEHVTGFKQTTSSFIHSCYSLGLQFLRIMAIGLDLENENFFVDEHGDLMSNCSTLRCLHYPPIPEEIELKPGQVRCGEHSDYGSITLLFQRTFGGLQVLNRDGNWIKVPPMKDAILVNIGDLMQRWTSDVLVSSKHKVLIPEDEKTRRVPRRSYAFFIQPRDDALIECIDGSSKYEGITSLDYLNYRFAMTY